LAVAVAFGLWEAGCASSADVEEAPLADARQKKLRENLVGTWEKTAVVPEGGERESTDEPLATWTFEGDGSGTRTGPGAPSSESGEGRFQWDLEGRNIVLEFQSGGSRYYRAETWSPRQMRWFNYNGSDVYILRRSSDSSGGRPNPVQPSH